MRLIRRMRRCSGVRLLRGAHTEALDDRYRFARETQVRKPVILVPTQLFTLSILFLKSDFIDQSVLHNVYLYI
jgi:hypothetical protein